MGNTSRMKKGAVRAISAILAAMTALSSPASSHAGILSSGYDAAARLERQRPGGCKATALAYALNILTGASRYSQAALGGNNCADVGGRVYEGSDGRLYEATYFADNEDCGKKALLEAVARSIAADLPIVASVHKVGTGTRHHWVTVVGYDGGGGYKILDPQTASVATMAGAGYDWGLADTRTYGYIGFAAQGGSGGDGDGYGGDDGSGYGDVDLEDGDFVTTAGGAIYRIAGGAPLRISGWSAFGGEQPTKTVTEGQLRRLPRYPAPGTLLRNVQTNKAYRVIEDGHIYLVSRRQASVQGAPLTDIDGFELKNPARLDCSPSGSVDRIARSEGAINVIGWAFDDDVRHSALFIRVYIGENLAASGRANLSRPDIGEAYPGVGGFHGFDLAVQTELSGRQRVRVYAVNAPGTAGLNACLADTVVNIRPDAAAKPR